MTIAPNAARFAPLAPERAAAWMEAPTFEPAFFPGMIGIQLEEVRTDYARMRLRFRPELNQPAGVMHGGAIATLIDTVVVPAIGQAYAEPRRFVTIDMQVQYLEPIVGEDLIAEGWITKRGRSTVFCRAEVFTASGALAATGTLVYKVGRPAA
ncbi:MAG: PaaI family thioesterase [Candidatus Binatia bacterium]